MNRNIKRTNCPDYTSAFHPKAKINNTEVGRYSDLRIAAFPSYDSGFQLLTIVIASYSCGDSP